MMDQNLFDQEAETEASFDENKNYLEELVGEGKKFKSVDDLARGKAEADAFIENLKTEMQQLREDLNTRITLEKFMDQVNKEKTSTQPEPGDGEREPEKSALTPEQIEALLENKISEREIARKAESNLQEVKTRLQEAYGPQYVTELDKRAKEIGVSRDFLSGLAAENPRAFYKMIDISPQTRESLFTPPSSDVRSPLKNVTGEKTKSYYDELRKTDPRRYYSPQVQNEMHSQALKLRDRFFDK